MRDRFGIRHVLTSVYSDGQDKGSQFTFWIPIDDDGGTTVVVTPSENAESVFVTVGDGSQSILLVEDNPINQVVIK